MFDNHKLLCWIRDRLDLTHSEKLIAMMIATYRNGLSGDCFPSRLRISVLSGLSREHVNRIIKSLKEKRVLRVKNSKLKVSRKKVCNYVFLFDESNAV